MNHPKLDHEYHFILDEERTEKLCSYIPFINSVKNLPELIAYILKRLYPFIEENHFSAYDHESKYLLVCDDLAIKRFHIHIHISFELQRRLKMIHSDLNLFSMAQLVRLVIDRFIALWEVWGEGLENYLYELEKKWNKIKEKHKNSKKPFTLRQLLNRKKLRKVKSTEIRLKIAYSKDFHPIEFYFR